MFKTTIEGRNISLPLTMGDLQTGDIAQIIAPGTYFGDVGIKGFAHDFFSLTTPGRQWVNRNDILVALLPKGTKIVIEVQ